MTKAMVPRGAKPTAASTYHPPAELAKAAAKLLHLGQAHRYITKEEVDGARAIADERRDDRLRLLIDLMWLTGARISEVLALEVRDLDLPHQVLSMPTLKRRGAGPPPRRGIPIPMTYIGEIVVFINTHGLTAADKLIDLGRTMAYYLLRDVLLAAGVEKARARPHAFRHGHAIHALKEGVPITIVQATLGHTSVLTTQIYARASGQDIAHSYARVNW